VENEHLLYNAAFTCRSFGGKAHISALLTLADRDIALGVNYVEGKVTVRRNDLFVAALMTLPVAHPV